MKCTPFQSSSFPLLEAKLTDITYVMPLEPRKFKHRRPRIYDETSDTIVGILNTGALLLDPTVDLADAIEFPSFVPETTNLLLYSHATSA